MNRYRITTWPGSAAAHAYWCKLPKSDWISLGITEQVREVNDTRTLEQMRRVPWGMGLNSDGALVEQINTGARQ